MRNASVPGDQISMHSCARLSDVAFVGDCDDITRFIMSLDYLFEKWKTNEETNHHRKNHELETVLP